MVRFGYIHGRVSNRARRRTPCPTVLLGNECGTALLVISNDAAMENGSDVRAIMCRLRSAGETDSQSATQTLQGSTKLVTEAGVGTWTCKLPSLFQ